MVNSDEIYLFNIKVITKQFNLAYVKKKNACFNNKNEALPKPNEKHSLLT